MAGASTLALRLGLTPLPPLFHALRAMGTLQEHVVELGDAIMTRLLRPVLDGSGARVRVEEAEGGQTTILSLHAPDAAAPADAAGLLERAECACVAIEAVLLTLTLTLTLTRTRTRTRTECACVAIEAVLLATTRSLSPSP